MLAGVTATTPFNAAMAGVQNIVRRSDLAAAELHGPPVFIVGHWRSGTTLLHELLVRDDRFGSPSTYQCFAPHHFLVTQWAFRRFGRWMVPGRRPMDNMVAGWDRPQEDEFALMNLGLPSPYRRIAFPRRGPVDMDYLDFDGVNDAALQTWSNTLQTFLRTVSVDTGRPLIVKSPTHTGRIGHLSKLFPDAKFIHITRNPRQLYPSTMRLWSSLDQVQGLHTDPEGDLGPYVLRCFNRMYNAYYNARNDLPEGRLIEVRYEDLIHDPTAIIEKIYHGLRLADFDSIADDLRHWQQTEHRQYQTNKHAIDANTEQTILRQWKEYFERYGY